MDRKCAIVVLPGAGHWIKVARPDVVDAAFVRLLERVRRPAPGRDHPWRPASG